MRLFLNSSKRVVLAAWLLVLAGGLFAAAPDKQYATGQAAVAVVGQQNFSANVPGATPYQFGTLTGLAVAGNRLIVADGSLPFVTPTNNRVLIFNDLASVVLNSNADIVVGQPDFNTTTPGLSEKTLNMPAGISTDGQRLAIADAGNDRILIFNRIPNANGVAADVVVGQSDFKSGGAGLGPAHMRVPNGVSLGGQRLLVADTQNHRVLIFNSVPSSNGASANVVLGQADFNSNADQAASATSLRSPTSVFSDGVRLVVTDLGHNRVLIWNRIPSNNNTPADVVVGQPDFTAETAQSGKASLNFPRDAYIDGGRLFIGDGGNNRILVFNSVPTANGAAADVVLGQKDFQTTLDPASTDPQQLTAAMLTTPTALAAGDGAVLVADSGNRRILKFAPGVPLFSQGAVVNVASFDGNGLPRPTNVNVDVQTGGSIPAGTYYLKVAAEGGILFESMPSEEVAVTVPDSTQLVVTFDEVSTATSYRAYIGGSPGGQVLYYTTATPASGAAIDRTITITSLDPTTTGATAGGPRLEITPGAITTLFGVDLAPTTEMAGSIPLPTELAGVSVLIDGTPAPLFYVSPTQINFQVPWETPGSSVSVVVQKKTRSGLVLSNAVVAPVSNLTPGVFTVSGDGTGRLLAFHADGTPVDDNNPLVAGEDIFFYGTGVQQVSFIGDVIATATLDTHPTGQISVTSDGGVTWSSSFTPTAQVYVSTDGGDPALLGEEASGFVDASGFIVAGHVYDFILRAADNGVPGGVLATVTLDTRTPGWGDVSSPDVPSPTASTVVATGDQTGTISVDNTGNVSWSLTNLATARAYMTTDGGPETLFADISSTSGNTSTTTTSSSTSTSSSSTVGPVSASTSTVVANPTTVVADNTTTSTITVTLLDANSNPVSGKKVSLTAASGTSSTITTVVGTTNASGQASFTVVDSKLETVTYTAKDTSDNLTIGTVDVKFASTAVAGSQQATIANGHSYQFILHRFGDPLALPSGEASPAKVAVNTTASVSIQDEDAPIQFVGLTPGFVGLFQWNVHVADDLSMTGGEAQVKVFVGSIPANLTTLPINDGATGTLDVTPDGVVTWSVDTTTASSAQVWLSTDGGGGALLFEGPFGSSQAGFVAPGHVFDFYLVAYRDGVLGRIIASVTLDTTNAPEGTLDVTPDGLVTWDVLPGVTDDARVFVAADGGDPVLFAEAPSGSQQANFIGTGHVYVFTLRAFRDGVLAEVIATVTLDTTSQPARVIKKPALKGPRVIRNPVPKGRFKLSRH